MPWGTTPWERLKALSDLGSRDPENREYDEERLQRAAIAYARSCAGETEGELRAAVIAFRRTSHDVMVLLGDLPVSTSRNEALTLLRMAILATNHMGTEAVL